MPVVLSLRVSIAELCQAQYRYWLPALPTDWLPNYCWLHSHATFATVV